MILSSRPNLILLFIPLCLISRTDSDSIEKSSSIRFSSLTPSSSTLIKPTSTEVRFVSNLISNEMNKMEEEGKTLIVQNQTEKNFGAESNKNLLERNHRQDHSESRSTTTSTPSSSEQSNWNETEKSRISSSQTSSSLSTIIQNLVVEGAEQLDASPLIPNLIRNSENNSTETLLIPKVTVKAPSILKLIHDYLLVLLLISVMFSMGSGVTLKEVLNHIQRPTAVIVCIVAQFFLVPFIGYLIMTIMNLDALHATGLLILSCCPGGVTSNIFTFLADGDLSLSITMTSVATISALLLMPMNVWLYGRNLETTNLVIPYVEMSLTLILITIPVLIGMYLNYRMPKITPYITKIGIFAGFGIICFCQSLEVIIFPDIFVGVPYKLYTAVILLPAFSFVGGYIFAKLFRLNEKICRTIGIEIGIKNVGSALTIISLSFSIQHLKKAWAFPFLYAFTSTLVIFAITIGFRAARNYLQKQSTKGFVAVDKIDTDDSIIDDDYDDDEEMNKSDAIRKQNDCKFQSKILEDFNNNNNNNNGDDEDDFGGRKRIDSQSNRMDDNRPLMRDSRNDSVKVKILDTRQQKQRQGIDRLDEINPYRL
ncbi:hypothetical protein NH340_JMT07969 [Sarcoptes scabiei]|nr:hypothetical protein NH340_JMT07969 [Sarcoptes scabiei]